MNTIKIEKFQVNRRYSSKSTNKLLLFHLQERNGKELTFTILRPSDRKTTAKGVAKVEAYKNGAREVVRICDNDCFYDIVATDAMPIGRKMSELSPERREIIEAAVKLDVERRKRLKIDRASVVTTYDIDKEGKAKYTGQIESDSTAK